MEGCKEGGGEHPGKEGRRKLEMHSHEMSSRTRH